MRSRMDGVEDRLGKLEARIDQVQTVCTDEVDALRHDMQKELDDVREEAREILDTELDDKADVIREEIKEFVVEQVDELGSKTSQDILQSLKDTEVRIKLDI
jgi:F0F1-type ATP synthase membrane subunit b/b'